MLLVLQCCVYNTSFQNNLSVYSMFERYVFGMRNCPWGNIYRKNVV